MRLRPCWAAIVAAHLLLFFGFVTAFTSEAAAAKAGYWPRFHGPKGDNISTETGLLKRWPDGGPKLLWTAKEIGVGYAGVTIADGLIYTSGGIDGKTVITALDTNGKMQWQVENGRTWEKSYPGSRDTPTIDGKRLICCPGGPKAAVVVLNKMNGRTVWTSPSASGELTSYAGPMLIEQLRLCLKTCPWVAGG